MCNNNIQISQTNPKLRALRTGMQTRRVSRLLPAFLVLVRLACPMASEAATIWTGPRITKSNADGPDQLTALVALTRGSSQGLYNSLQESSFTHFLSPKDTEWADRTTANTSLTYTDWDTWAKTIHGGPPSTVGVNAVLHLKTDNIYIDIEFLSWEARSGGYSYTRSTPAVANVPPSVTITNPPDNASFTNGATVNIQATASDSDGSVTNVQFFDGVVSLGNDSTSPYSVSASLAPGSHTDRKSVV